MSSRITRSKIRSMSAISGQSRAGSLRPQHGDYERTSRISALDLSPMSDLDLMIANGWGDTPQRQLPADWRTRKRRP